MRSRRKVQTRKAQKLHNQLQARPLPTGVGRRDLGAAIEGTAEATSATATNDLAVITGIPRQFSYTKNMYLNFI